MVDIVTVSFHRLYSIECPDQLLAERGGADCAAHSGQGLAWPPAARCSPLPCRRRSTPPPRSFRSCALSSRRHQVQDQGQLERRPNEERGDGGACGLGWGRPGVARQRGASPWGRAAQPARPPQLLQRIAGVPLCSSTPCVPAAPAHVPAGQVCLHARLQPAARQAAHRFWHGRQGTPSWAESALLGRSGPCSLLLSPRCSPAAAGRAQQP